MGTPASRAGQTPQAVPEWNVIVNVCGANVHHHWRMFGVWGLGIAEAAGDKNARSPVLVRARCKAAFESAASDPA